MGQLRVAEGNKEPKKFMSQKFLALRGLPTLGGAITKDGNITVVVLGDVSCKRDEGLSEAQNDETTFPHAQPLCWWCKSL